MKWRIRRRPCSITKKQYSSRKGQRRDSEEVEGDDHLTVIVEKRKPPFAGVTTAPHAPQIPGHTPFGNNEPQLQQFAVNPGSPPVGVLFREPPNQTTDFLTHPRMSTARAGAPAPVEPETGTVRGDDGLRLHDHEEVASSVARSGGAWSRIGGPESSTPGATVYASARRPAGGGRGPPGTYRCDCGGRLEPPRAWRG